MNPRDLCPVCGARLENAVSRDSARIHELERLAGLLLRRAELVESSLGDFLCGYHTLPPEALRALRACTDLPKTKEDAVSGLRLAARIMARRANAEAHVGPIDWSTFPKLPELAPTSAREEHDRAAIQAARARLEALEDEADQHEGHAHLDDSRRLRP